MRRDDGACTSRGRGVGVAGEVVLATLCWRSMRGWSRGRRALGLASCVRLARSRERMAEVLGNFADGLAKEAVGATECGRVMGVEQMSDFHLSRSCA